MTRYFNVIFPVPGRLVRWLAATAAMLTLGAAQASSSTLIRNESLYSSPSTASKMLLSVPQGSVVEMLSRSGGWVQVSYRGYKGWVRLLSLRSGTKSNGNALSNVTSLTQSRNNNVVAVAGLRGLDEADLKNASFNQEELKRMDSYVVSPEQATRFASQGKLNQRQVAFLPDTEKKNETPTSGFEFEGLQR